MELWIILQAGAVTLQSTSCWTHPQSASFQSIQMLNNRNSYPPPLYSSTWGGLNCCYWPCCSLTSLGKFPPSIPAWWRATQDESDDSSAERKGGKQKINASAVTALFMCKTLEKLVTRLQGYKVSELQSASSRRNRKKKNRKHGSSLHDLKCRTINRHRFQSYSRDSDGYVLVNPTDSFLTCGGSLEMRHSRSLEG